VLLALASCAVFLCATLWCCLGQVVGGLGMVHLGCCDSKFCSVPQRESEATPASLGTVTCVAKTTGSGDLGSGWVFAALACTLFSDYGRLRLCIPLFVSCDKLVFVTDWPAHAVLQVIVAEHYIGPRRPVTDRHLHTVQPESATMLERSASQNPVRQGACICAQIASPAGTQHRSARLR
jgi:hypothetical protein